MNMFWNKKDEKKSLPDLPQIKSPFSKELSVSSENTGMVEEKLKEGENKHALPSFPDSPTNQGFSQTAIKEAISHDGIKSNIKVYDSTAEVPPDSGEKFKAVEMEDEKKVSKEENPYLVSMTEYPRQKVSYTQQITPYGSKVVKQNSQSAALINPPPSEDEEKNGDEETNETFTPIAKIERPADSQKGHDIFVKIEKFYSAKKSLEAIKGQVDQIDDLLKKIKDIKLKEERELGVWEKEIALVKSRIQNVNDTIFEKIS